jgi:hypothetical protein
VSDLLFTKVSVLVAAVLAVSCQDATKPSPISPPPDVLAIEPALDGLTLGSSHALTAVIVSGDGKRRTVAASWASDAPEVVTIDANGRIFGARLGRSTIRVSSDALSGSVPLRVVPDYAGSWIGEYRLKSCGRLSGAGPDPYCRFTVGGVFRIRTTLMHDGATVSGTLDLFDNTGRVIVETGSVDGVIDAANTLILSGTTFGTDPAEHSESTLSEWSTALAADGASMTGRFVRNWTFQNFWGPQSLKITGEPLTMQR